MSAITKKVKTKIQPKPSKAIKNLANSIYETLKQEGCENKDIIGVSSQLIGLVTSSIESTPSSSNSQR